MTDLPHLPEATQQKLSRAETVLRELGSVVVAFSAGVDSTLLLALAARALGAGGGIARDADILSACAEGVPPSCVAGVPPASSPFPAVSFPAGQQQKQQQQQQQKQQDAGKMPATHEAKMASPHAGETHTGRLPASRVLAAIGLSASVPQRERAQARELARQIGVELVEIPTGEMDNPEYRANPAERCFFCKSDLFGRLLALAKERGLSAVVCGANADDAGDFRPGLRAGEKLGVRNPLMDAGLTKPEIREISRALGLPTWDKPAMACLASRIPYGQEITPQRLSRVEKAEDLLKDLGFAACRVRDHDQLARIEIPAADFDRFLTQRQRVCREFKAMSYVYVCLDLQGLRTGSMNEAL